MAPFVKGMSLEEGKLCDKEKTHQRWLKPPTGRCGGACQTLGRSCKGSRNIGKVQDSKHGVGLGRTSTSQSTGHRMLEMLEYMPSC